MTKTRKTVVPIVISGVCFAFYTLHKADQIARRGYISAPSVPSTPSAPAITPAGTWLADTGHVFQYRSDGTGRSRAPSSNMSKVHYFEWTSDGATFTLHYVPRGRMTNFIAYQFGHETTGFSIIELTGDTLILGDSGTQTQLVRTTDALLDGAP